MGNERSWMDVQIEKLELLKIFDPCIHEMTKLLNNSKHRFKYAK